MFLSGRSLPCPTGSALLQQSLHHMGPEDHDSAWPLPSLLHHLFDRRLRPYMAAMSGLVLPRYLASCDNMDLPDPETQRER